MAISCAYCGGEHARPADVRACWTEHGERDVPLDDAPTPPEVPGPVHVDPGPTARRPAPAPVHRASAPVHDVQRGAA
ncbi:MAG: hypothetical protein WBV89_21305, partial [Ilumatobacter sp.]